jgi:hypothetical protein
MPLNESQQQELAKVLDSDLFKAGMEQVLLMTDGSVDGLPPRRGRHQDVQREGCAQRVPPAPQNLPAGIQAFRSSQTTLIPHTHIT